MEDKLIYSFDLSKYDVNFLKVALEKYINNPLSKVCELRFTTERPDIKQLYKIDLRNVAAKLDNLSTTVENNFLNINGNIILLNTTNGKIAEQGNFKIAPRMLWSSDGYHLITFDMILG